MTVQKSKDSKTDNKKALKYYLKHLVAAVICAVVFISIVLFFLGLITRHSQKLEVPSFTGLSMEEAMDLADANSLRLEVTDSIHNNRMAPGVICKQNPKAGGYVKKNRRILLTINAISPKYVQAPQLVGFSLRQALSSLAASGLEIGKLVYVEDIATNNVIGQYLNGRALPAGAMVPQESSIDLKLGLNAEEAMTYMPMLKGTTYQQLRNSLAEHSLNLGRIVFESEVSSYSDSLESFVYRTVPPYYRNSTVHMGTKVDVYLTKDKEKLNYVEPEPEPADSLDLGDIADLNLD